MDTIAAINSAINNFVWGAPCIILIMGVGLFFTIRLKGIQFRNWGFMIKETYVKAFKKRDDKADSQGGEGEITSFQAAMASVSAVVGSGNIAGVATAIVMGGPGALFWMLVAALVGMATKYAEIGLGIKYREKASDGSYVGGPMYYLAKGLHAPWLGHIVAILVVFYSIVISAVVDTNTMTAALNETFGLNTMIGGVIFAVLTAIVIFGGITRIGEVCGLLSPIMAGAYLLCGLLVIVLNITKVPSAIATIVVSAFNPSAALGGAAGISILTVMRYGMARGIFSNEAGVGTAAIT
ncbi:MAG: alanine/glycine:cation symporter family protein, partial [Candidatus Pararuminococcus gallinarum]